VSNCLSQARADIGRAAGPFEWLGVDRWVTLRDRSVDALAGGRCLMLRVGLDLSRRGLDVCVLSDEGELIEELAVPRDAEVWGIWWASSLIMVSWCGR
jgi:hypothetical protein